MLSKSDTVKQSTTTHVVNCNRSVIVIKNIPCEECKQCGEIFYIDEIAEHNPPHIHAMASIWEHNKNELLKIWNIQTFVELPPLE